MNFTEKIRRDEQQYNDCLEALARRVSANSSLRLLTLAGPSCSGKTTTTAKLLAALRRFGRDAYMLSIDDFYKSAAEMPKKPDGEPDFEALDSFDLDALHTCLYNLTSGNAADIPHFDFLKGRRSDVSCRMTLPADGIAVIEGLHALNPVIYQGFIPENQVLGVFLDCRTASPSPVHYSRLMRRLVRDYFFRRADAEKTFYLWENVLVGEKKYIYPYASLAAVTINTRFDYEPQVLRDSVIRIVSELSAHSKYRVFAETITAYLSALEPIDPALVPADSLLREFIG